MASIVNIYLSERSGYKICRKAPANCVNGVEASKTKTRLIFCRQRAFFEG